jgi:hypothetical protein
MNRKERREGLVSNWKLVSNYEKYVKGRGDINEDVRGEIEKCDVCFCVVCECNSEGSSYIKLSGGGRRLFISEDSLIELVLRIKKMEEKKDVKGWKLFISGVIDKLVESKMVRKL